MIQVIGIPMVSDPEPFFANFFLDHKEADCFTAQRKLGTINVQKIINSFQLIDDLLSLNDGSTFYFSNIPSKMFYESIGTKFLRISRATSKTEDLSRNCKHLLSQMGKWGESNFP